MLMYAHCSRGAEYLKAAETKAMIPEQVMQCLKEIYKDVDEQKTDEDKILTDDEWMDESLYMFQTLLSLQELNAIVG